MNASTRSKRRGLWVLCFTLQSLFYSCSWPFGGAASHDEVSADKDQSEPVDTSESKPIKIKKPMGSDVQLKQARIWNRLEEVEEELRAQRQRIKLLEQGLLTGIPPEELKHPEGNHKLSHDKLGNKSKKKEKSSKSGLPDVVLDLPEKPESSAGEDSSASSPDSYRVRIQVAKDYYQSSRFGMAVAEIAQIMRAFGPKAGDGEARYWLGRSYLGLKEYATARAELELFVKSFPQHEQVPMARLELAKALTGMNLRDRSRRELTKIAKDYEGQEAGEMASAELRNMKGAL